MAGEEDELNAVCLCVFIELCVYPETLSFLFHVLVTSRHSDWSSRRSRLCYVITKYFIVLLEYNPTL
ncbi:hypothetical protein KUCAC02_010325 [Chaenocephalus aceratus]|uniref:Uncharacterized protein n=1 Tax=Chaenocephalus aceratus TaxID=36190 RepID=A0ACB9VZL2_CHAAC|nr:hypothetical protein KUCAC02_010325 [Chaenocephalus aceratus]